MNIPSSVVKTIEKTTSPMENTFFLHVKSAMNAMNHVTEDTYCYDFVAMEANILERLYKGFLKAATVTCEWYRLPSERFLESDHDILGMVLEIKDNFPDVFPRVEREVWRQTKNFLRDLRREYSLSRYESYPTYTEFAALRGYVNAQYKLIEDYIKEGHLEQSNDRELDLDY